MIYAFELYVNDGEGNDFENYALMRSIQSYIQIECDLEYEDIDISMDEYAPCGSGKTFSLTISHDKKKRKWSNESLEEAIIEIMEGEFDREDCEVSLREV